MSYRQLSSATQAPFRSGDRQSSGHVIRVVVFAICGCVLPKDSPHQPAKDKGLEQELLKAGPKVDPLLGSGQGTCALLRKLPKAYGYFVRQAPGGGRSPYLQVVPDSALFSAPEPAPIPLAAAMMALAWAQLPLRAAEAAAPGALVRAARLHRLFLPASEQFR